MEPNPPIGIGTITAARGALVNNIYAQRAVMTYAIQDNDLVTLGLLTTMSTIFLSLTTAIGGFMASVWYQQAITNDQTVKNISGGLLRVCWIALAVSFVISVSAAGYRWWTMRQIKRASRPS